MVSIKYNIEKGILTSLDISNPHSNGVVSSRQFLFIRSDTE